MNDVIGSVRQVLQDFLALELRQHRAELVSIRSEIGWVCSELATKIEAAESHLDSKIDAVESRLDSKIEVPSQRCALVSATKRVSLCIRNAF